MSYMSKNSSRRYEMCFLTQQIFEFDDQYFTARRSYASAILGLVILSVCLSHACFVTKPNNALRIF